GRRLAHGLHEPARVARLESLGSAGISAPGVRATRRVRRRPAGMTVLLTGHFSARDARLVDKWSPRGTGRRPRREASATVRSRGLRGWSRKRAGVVPDP